MDQKIGRPQLVVQSSKNLNVLNPVNFLRCKSEIQYHIIIIARTFKIQMTLFIQAHCPPSSQYLQQHVQCHPTLSQKGYLQLYHQQPGVFS